MRNFLCTIYSFYYGWHCSSPVCQQKFFGELQICSYFYNNFCFDLLFCQSCIYSFFSYQPMKNNTTFSVSLDLKSQSKNSKQTIFLLVHILEKRESEENETVLIHENSIGACPKTLKNYLQVKWHFTERSIYTNIS